MKRITVLIFSWAGLFCALHVLTKQQTIVVDSNSNLSLKSSQSPAGFQWFIADNDSHRPKYYVAYETLDVQNGNMGVFKTSLYKNFFVNNLHINVHTYDDGCSEGSDLSDVASREVCTAIKMFPRHWGKLFTLKDHVQTELDTIGKAFEVHIRDLEIQWIVNQRNFFTLSGKKAHMQLNNPTDVVLRGHVILKTHQKKLEAGHVVWDIKNNTFQVHGLYTMTQSGQRITGHDICLNIQLEQNDQKKHTGEDYYAYKTHSDFIVD